MTLKTLVQTIIASLVMNKVPNMFEISGLILGIAGVSTIVI